MAKITQGKPRMSLLPWTALRTCARVMEWAITRKVPPYKRGDWKNVPIEEWVDAAVRHLGLRIEGEVYDDESGFDHLAHAAVSVLCALWVAERKAEIDNGRQDSIPGGAD